MCGHTYKKHHHRWGSHHDKHGYKHHEMKIPKHSPLAMVVILLIALFLVSKAWWLIFVLPAVIGPISYALSGHHEQHADKDKRKNNPDNPFYDEDDRLHYARPVKRQDEKLDYYDGETVIL